MSKISEPVPRPVLELYLSRYTSNCVKNLSFPITGKELYLFDSQYLVRGYPKPLDELGLPASLEKLDAAMVWGHNGKTYFYSGTMYWK